VSIALTRRLDRAEPEASSRAFEVFARGIDAGASPREKVCLTSATVNAHEEHGLFVETWKGTFPRTSPGAFAVFARLAATSVPGAKRLEIWEHADERALVVRSFDRDTEATIVDVPWHIAFVQAPQAAVRIVFVEPITATTADRAAVALQAWADVLALGGFPGIQGVAVSTGLLSGVDATAERELLLRFERLACGYDVWEALFEALVPVDQEASIERVEITESDARSGLPSAAQPPGLPPARDSCVSRGRQPSS